MTSVASRGARLYGDRREVARQRRPPTAQQERGQTRKEVMRKPVPVAGRGCHEWSTPLTVWALYGAPVTAVVCGHYAVPGPPTMAPKQGGG